MLYRATDGHHCIIFFTPRPYNSTLYIYICLNNFNCSGYKTDESLNNFCCCAGEANLHIIIVIKYNIVHPDNHRIR